jgi:biopolymer transport protein ExbB
MRVVFLLFLTMLALVAPRSAEAWWNNDWSFRKRIVLDLSAAGLAATADMAQVPMLIRLHAGNFGFTDTQEDGSDLRIISADDKTPLPFRIEKYDWVNGLGYIWVQLPRIGGPAAQSFIWLYYGNANAKPASDLRSIWDANQTLVYHFAEKELLPRDASGFGNNATRSTAALDPAGQIDVAAHYDGGAVTIVPASASLKLTAKDGFTFSAWIRSEASQSAVLFQQQDGKRSLTIALDNDQPVVRLVGDDGRLVSTPLKARLAPGAWHHLAVAASDRVALYVDGVEAATLPVVVPDLSGDIALGGTAVAGGNFKGLLDEVRLSNRARSADWIKFEVETARPDTQLLSFGEDEQAEGRGDDYLATISVLVGAVSLDGWIVIGLIALLGFVSGEVAISKALMLRRARRANDLFLKLFRGQGADLMALANADTGGKTEWKDSPLFTVYSAGAEELGRLRQSLGENQRFTSLSLDVVRASVDTSLVNEANRINDKMVLLTLAVSGAPFLGLFGTVVGIMITFATIALKGDVNINTIAPGIAAALTATVSGMLVAIPALFGYNVLMTRIKEITTVMETFRDELLSKIAASIA